MASCSYSPVEFVNTCEDAFYFKEVAADTDVVKDSFGIAGRCLCYWVQSKDNKFLLLNTEQEFQVQNLTNTQLNQPDCMFKVQKYREFANAGREGMPTMLYVKKDEGKNVVVSCGRDHNVYSENMDAVPEAIEETHHKALFYMTKLTASNTYQFESSMFQSEFLGFACDEGNPSLKKLVLHKKGSDEVDDSCQIVLSRNSLKGRRP